MEERVTYLSLWEDDDREDENEQEEATVSLDAVTSPLLICHCHGMT